MAATPENIDVVQQKITLDCYAIEASWNNSRSLVHLDSCDYLTLSEMCGYLIPHNLTEA